MGWKFWKSEPTAAERFQAASASSGDEWDPVPEDDLGEPERPSWPQLYLTVTAGPASSAPGTWVAVVNEGERLHVGDEVQAVGTFATQFGTVVAITRDGVGVEQLDYDEEGHVVLDDELDLGQLFRGSALIHPEDGAGEPQGVAFRLGVLRAEPRGADALVIGLRLDGEPEAGQTVQGNYGDGETPWVATLRSVEVVDGDVGLLLADVPAERFLRGDVVFAVHP